MLQTEHFTMNSEIIFECETNKNLFGTIVEQIYYLAANETF